MSNFHFGAVFASITIFLFMGVFLVLQRRLGERSRMILAGMMFLSVANYTNHIFNIYQAPAPFEVMPVHLLLIGIYMMVIYIMYPIEVVSPGWLTWRRLLKVYVPLTAGLVLTYKIPQWFGVEYTRYTTFSQLLANPLSTEVVLRYALALLIFVPSVLPWIVPYTRKYNNSNHQWMSGYTVVWTINVVAYLTALTINSGIIRPIYYLVSVLCSSYIFYQEMTVRLIREKTEDNQQPSASLLHEADAEPELFQIEYNRLQGEALLVAIEEYMNRELAWRDPDFSMTMLVDKLRVNRRAVVEALHQGGYDGYPSYINNKRVSDCISLIKSGNANFYQDAYYDVGFRSKSTALRNFKEVTGTIPSEYFNKQD